MGKYLLFLLFPVYLAAEYVDIATCINDRVKQYETKSYQKVFLCSPYRTGSTYTFNVLRYLFENHATQDDPQWGGKAPQRKVCKYHSLENRKPENAIVFTIRNPVDACFSYFRVAQHRYQNRIVAERNIVKLVDQEMEPWYQFESLLTKKKPFLLLRYEEFSRNMDYLFQKIERFFSITIEEEDKELLRKALARENVIANVKKYSSFAQSNGSTLFHGEHVDEGKISKEDRARITAKIMKRLKRHKAVIRKWGYGHIFQ